MKTLKYILLLGFNLALATPQSFAEDTSPSNLTTLEQKSNQGDASAQYNLGLMYEYGQGVPQDYAKAMEYYTKAANQGFAGAQNNLGLMYKNGQGVPEDYFRAVEWFTKAANQGSAGGQTNLGIMYEDGKGVPQDNIKAKAYFKTACLNKFQPGCDAYKALNTDQ